LNTIATNKALTDSLSLKIPFKECDILDERLTSYTCIYYESLNEIDCELHPPKPIIISQNGITIRISLAEIPIYNADTQQKVNVKFINLTLSAKLLKHRYFEGITAENLHLLYEEFMRFEVFECSYKVFKSGYISDIDVCTNRYVSSPATFHDILKELVSQSGTKEKYSHLISQNENLGLTFNKRAFAKPSLPFIKLYFKHWELLSKSAEFFNTYLYKDYANQIKNLTRVECTIKNYEHKRRLDKFGIFPMFKTLEEYLKIPQRDLYRFICFSVGAYVETKSRLKAPNLSPTEHVIFELLQNCVIKGYDFETLLLVVNSFKGSTEKSTQVAKSRMRSKIKELFDFLIHKDIKIQTKANNNNHVIEYLKTLGVEY